GYQPAYSNIVVIPLICDLYIIVLLYLYWRVDDLRRSPVYLLNALLNNGRISNKVIHPVGGGLIPDAQVVHHVAQCGTRERANVVFICQILMIFDQSLLDRGMSVGE